MALDLRIALNAVSDVVNNRPPPLREFDQIYMKVGDMVVHAEFVARRFSDRNVVFVGDGDAIGLAIAHLMNGGVIDYGPSHITVLDFDERVVNSVNRFARHNSAERLIDAALYNVIDNVPREYGSAFTAFHINPPWGQHNDGESVVVFLERAIELISVGGLGICVLADDPGLRWTSKVLRRCQLSALENGMVVDEMIPSFHQYHLDDAPDLRSCAIVLRKIEPHVASASALTPDRLENFYGRTQELRVRYVRERPNLGRGTAPDETYYLETLRGSKNDTR